MSILYQQSLNPSLVYMWLLYRKYFIEFKCIHYAFSATKHCDQALKPIVDTMHFIFFPGSFSFQSFTVAFPLPLLLQWLVQPRIFVKDDNNVLHLHAIHVFYDENSHAVISDWKCKKAITHYPCSRAVFTAREHGCHFGHQWTWPMLTGRVR